MRLVKWKRMLAALTGCALLTASGCAGGEAGSASPSRGDSPGTTGAASTSAAASSPATTQTIQTTQAPTTQPETKPADTTTSTAAGGTTTANPAPVDERTTDIGIWYSTWYARQADNSPDNKVNTWTAWKIPFKPLLPDGRYETYDSLDKEVTRFHLKMISEAQIDFIIMDQTNNIDVDGGYINARSLSVAQTIKEYNDDKSHRPVKYCSAIGGIQWSQDAATIENEARILWTRYCSQDFGGEDYHYMIDGKPVMVVYGDGARDKWEAYAGDKTYAEKFSIRWADNASRPGYWGWAFDQGTKEHWETMVVMPGWNNMKGATPVPRRYGETYKKSWDVVLNAETKPRILVINSFNEYAERTAVFPADSSGAVPISDRWLNEEYEVDNTMYWEMTVDYIRRFKAMNKPLTVPYA